MINYVKKTIEKRKSRRTLNEYGFEVKSFDLEEDGRVEYAQWLHPLEQPKSITQGMVNFFKKYAAPGTLILDIGAHTGDTAVPMAIAAGLKGAVLALEPNPYVYKILLKNSELNKRKARIVPLDFAATDVDGEFEFNYSDASFCNGGFFQRIQNQKHGHKYTLKVKGRNLEDFLEQNYSTDLQRLALVKVDAEGYDKEILKSIKPILMKYKPNIISECNKNLTPGERTELFDVIDGLRYDLFKMDGFNESSRLTPITISAQMTDWKHFDLVALPKVK